MALDEMRTFELTRETAKWIRPETVIQTYYGERQYIGRLARARHKGLKVILYIARRDGGTFEPYMAISRQLFPYGYQVTVNITASTEAGVTFPTEFYEETERPMPCQKIEPEKEPEGPEEDDE